MRVLLEFPLPGFPQAFSMVHTESIQNQMQGIRLLLSDIDGVLTDGKLVYGSDGVEIKEFHVRDGLAVRIWKSCGYPFGLVTARESATVEKRAAELKVDFLLQSRPGKLKAVVEVAREAGVDLSEVCYLGDDLHDLGAVREAGLGVTVADGAEEVKQEADLVLQSRGGAGALRELVESLLKAKGEWSGAVESFYSPG